MTVEYVEPTVMIYIVNSTHLVTIIAIVSVTSIIPMMIIICSITVIIAIITITITFIDIIITPHRNQALHVLDIPSFPRSSNKMGSRNPYTLTKPWV